MEHARAELTGNTVEATRGRLRLAEEVLARSIRLRAANVVSQQQLNNDLFAVELLRAELTGNGTEVLRVRLRHAEEDFERALELWKQKLISESEYNRSKSALEFWREELAKALQRKPTP